MLKVSTFQAETEYGPAAIPLFSAADNVFEKFAAPTLLPDVVRYIEALSPRNDSQYVLVNAMGASEFFGCFPAGTLVQTAHGEVPIEQVQIGTEVRTHRNRFRKVQAVQPKECFGLLADLYIQGLPQLLPALTATPNHELRVVLRDEFVRARRAVVYKGNTLVPVEERREQLFSDISFDWIPMGDLQRGDLIAQPFPLEEDVDALGEGWADPHIAFLMGLYAAEGCLVYKYDRQDKLRNGKLEQPLSGVVFVVGEHEEKTVLRAQKAAGAHGYALTIMPGEETHSIRLELSWQGFAELCKDHVGSGAVVKRLSGAVLRMPRGWQKELFFAYAGGDGYTTKDCPGAGSQRCTSASVGLLVDMRLLLARLGMVSSISGRYNKKATWYNGNPIFELLVGSSQLSGVQSQAKSYIHPEGFILSAVHHVKEYAWEGAVYDLQVEEDCSYTASGISVHNSNINGDAFPEASLLHVPDNWTGNPVLDKIRAKDWPYGYPTFYNAHPFAHHRNKDASRAFGEVELAVWHEKMKRVELVTRVDKEKCEQFGGVAVWDKLHAAQFPDVSMGTRVPYDTCSICLDWKLYRQAQATFRPGVDKHPGDAVLRWHKAKKQKDGKGIRGVSITRKDYCDHALKMMNRILPDGRKVFVYNDYPKFFDISFVFIGADRTAKTMLKIAGEGRVYSMPSAVLAEKLGYDESAEVLAPAFSMEKAASDQVHKKTEFQGIPIHVDRPKGFVQEFKGDTPYKRVYKTDYGFVPGTEGGDGEELDVYLGPKHDASHAYVIQQMSEGKKDEKKVMLGFANQADAKKMYLSHMSPAFKGTVIGSIDSVPMEKFKERLVTKKTASLDETLKTAFLGKLAKNKQGEIEKDVVPSQFAGKAVPLLTKHEKDLPKDLLNLMGSLPLEKSLATTGGLGIVLRPREFQRIILISIGKREMADRFEDEGAVFPKSDEEMDLGLSGKDFHSPLARLLLPLLGERSALGPHIEKRVVIMGGKPAGEQRRSSSHPSSVLHKMGAAYNSYRRDVMELIPNTQNFLSELAGPNSSDLRKIAAASASDVFTSLSVAYIQNAFLDEFGQATQIKLSQAFANVERVIPSRNTSRATTQRRQ